MKKRELIGGLLKRINKYDVDNWNHRIAVQKLIYILQYGLKEKFNYNFNWYIYGPYSPDLASDFYELKSTDNTEEVKHKSKILDDRFEKFVELIKKYKDDTNILEIIASMIYISNKNKNMSESEIYEEIKDLKPYFNDDEYDESMKVFKKIKKLDHLNLT